MAAKLILPDAVIDVEFVPVLLYGPPGIGKSQIAQTACKPITLDFDRGAHRMRLDRGAVMQFDAWKDVIEEGDKGTFRPFQTIVIDTGGRALDTMIPDILKESTKNGYNGNLSPQGWGVLGSRFNTWMKTVRSWGKDVVMLCHQTEENDTAGNMIVKPEFPGKMAWKEVHKSFDIMGVIRQARAGLDGRVIEFSPGEGWTAKNAPGFEPTKVPDLAHNTTFLADLIELAKKRIGMTSAQAAEIAEACEGWAKILAGLSDLSQLNDVAPDVAKLSGVAKSRVWALIEKHAAANHCRFDKTLKRFVEN